MPQKKHGGARKGAGRKAPDGKRKKVVNVLFNEKEYKKLVEKAKGKNISTYIREKALD